MEANKTEFAPAPEAKLHFLDYWRIIRIRKTVILAVFLLVALTTTVVTYLLPPTYSSKVVISIEPDMPDVDPQGRIMFRPMADPFFIQTEFQRIQSKPVLTNVVEALNLREEWGKKYKQPGPLDRDRAFALLKGSIRVNQQQNTTLVEIHAYSDNKYEAAVIANKVAEIYAKVRHDARAKITSSGLEGLAAQLQQKEVAITNQQHLVNQLRTDLGITEVDAANNGFTPSIDNETLRKVTDSQLSARDLFLEVSNKWATLKSLSREQLKDAASLMLNDNRLSGLIDEENKTRQKLSSLLGRGLDAQHPDILAASQLLGTVTNQLEGALSGVLIGLQTEMNNQLAKYQNYTQFVHEARTKDT